MKYKINQEKGVTMIALVVTIIILLTVTTMLIYNAQDSIHIRALTNLYNDIELLRDKVSEYYNEYGEIPGKIKYTNIDKLSSVLSIQNDIGHDFYVIDLEAMKGITLNYGKDYEKIKTDPVNCNKYTDIYIINENSHNIFYVQGINIEEKNVTQTYYTDYIEPDETIVDLRYIDGILIPENYYYIGKNIDNSGNESMVISKNKNEQVNDTSQTQYIWQKNISNIEKLPDSIKLSEQQSENEFIKSVNNYKGYFKNKNKSTEIDIIYLPVYEDEWSEVYTKESEYKDENGDTAYIPKSFRVSMAPTMNKIDKGLVAKDENNNEYVWIEVPREKVFKTAEASDQYKNIKEDLIKYIESSSNYRESEYEDEYYEGCGVEALEGKTEAEVYVEMYNKMLSSIYTNGGFWISRYEIGDSKATENNTIRTNETIGVPVSKPNQIPYNYVTCKEAQKLASGMLTGTDKTSSLLFGIQWDLVCKFLEEKREWNTTEHIASYYIKENSTSWGNYNDANIKITSDKAKQSILNTITWKLEGWEVLQTTIKPEKSNIMLTTGASDNAKKMNIYDFAGNEWEWVLEKSSIENSPSTCRGGCANTIGTFSSSYRYYNTISHSACNLGFRSTIY